MVHSALEPPIATSLDTILTRDRVRVACLPLEKVTKRRTLDAEHLVIRFLYKKDTGVLWVFNKSFVGREWFREIPSPTLGLGVTLN